VYVSSAQPREVRTGGVPLWYEHTILHDGGFVPENFTILEAAFTAAWTHIEGLSNGVVREVARHRLASLIVVLGKSHGQYASSLEAIEAFDCLSHTECGNGLAWSSTQGIVLFARPWLGLLGDYPGEHAVSAQSVSPANR
jgi:hypothetical protein